jgi:alpha-L-fucosidase
LIQPVPVSLEAYFNNRGIGAGPGAADFDGQGNAYPASALPSAGSLALDGVTYAFPGDSEDNVVALGQAIPIPPGHYASAYLLVASSREETTGSIKVRYDSGADTSAVIDSPVWQGAKVPGSLTTPFSNTAGGRENRTTQIFGVQAWLDSSRTAVALTLPATQPVGPAAASMHVFAISLQPVVAGYAVKVIDARSTTKTGAGKGQIVEATVVNAGSELITPQHPAAVTVEGPGIALSDRAAITALGPGEQTPVEIDIHAAPSVPAGTVVKGALRAAVAGGLGDTEETRLTLGVPAYAPTVASLSTHTAPDWYDGAKFGIFIHWGLYSVPAWAPVGGTYEEWYWHSMSQHGSPTYRHELKVYGPKATYDNFIAGFTADRFNPRTWVRLFALAGARYFVLVAKHHDGFALFNTKVSGRSSVALGPHRDLVAALFRAARRYAPSLHPGVYYSLPEWYNPDFHWDQRFPGGPPQQYVTGADEPYTGYRPVKNYVEDVQVPQMRELIDQYHPDLFWCDIGGPNDSLKVIAHLYNEAASEPHPRQVAVNNRCGVAVHDFLTPEYRTYGTAMPVKWEATRGVDPHSFGYNAATPNSRYATARQLIGELVDVVSKNGNFLLDIGPRADGTIPAIMATRLSQIGAWLRVNGEAIYDTIPWWRTPQYGALRFTVRPNQAFYITSLARPSSELTVRPPVPIAPGDRITFLGWHGPALAWHMDGSHLVIDVPASARRSGRYAWTFKIEWPSPH